jgi:proline iminopeptidase
MVTLGLAGVGPTASADQSEPLTIVLQVRDTAHVPDEVLTGAQAHVTANFRQTGVQTVSRDLLLEVRGQMRALKRKSRTRRIIMLHDTATAEGHQVNPRVRSMRRAGAVAMATGLAVIVGLSLSSCANPGPTSKVSRELENGEYAAELNGVRVWYKVSGSGPVCLMPTPAWGPSSDLYFRTLGSMEKLLTVVYVDSRGTGRSGRATKLDEYTWDHLVGDLDALRMHLGQEQVCLMGHSEGGVQVLHYAIKHPGRVSGLILLSSLGAGDSAWRADVKRRQERRRGGPWYEEAARALEAGAPPTDEEFARSLRASLPLYWSDPARIKPYEDDFAATLVSAHAAKASSASGRSSFDLRPELKNVRAPTLIVVGADDFICSPEPATLMHLALPNSKLLLIEDSGHFPWMEQREVFDRKVPEFVDAMGLSAK